MRRRIVGSRGTFQVHLVVVATFFPALLLGQSASPPSPGPQDAPSIVRAASPSVVMIILRDQTGAELGRGSGFVVNGDGSVVTNAHVLQVSGATQAEVRFSDGASYQVKGIAAIDGERDLALFKLGVIGKDFRALHLGDSERVEVGQHIIAIGSPLAGFSTVSTETTVSDGIVSGIRDWPNGKMKVFQITAPLSPGSSGGVLLNTSSEVVGVTFAQLREGQNLNFAVPVNYVRLLLASDSPLKTLSEINSASRNDLNRTTDDGSAERPNVAGSYTGGWQSGKFAVSGAASMTVRLDGTNVTAQIFLTGGEVKSAILTGIASKIGENIWTVELSSKHPRLSVRGIFRSNSFVGDYTYTRFLMLDQGQWILKKE